MVPTIDTQANLDKQKQKQKFLETVSVRRAAPGQATVQEGTCVGSWITTTGTDATYKIELDKMLILHVNFIIQNPAYWFNCIC